ncbi:hypothetical protein KKC94_00675 [Patescibacteria group bacterium]|nr:hypothetical protein [Patescibacteria group bacterium]
MQEGPKPQAEGPRNIEIRSSIVEVKDNSEKVASTMVTLKEFQQNYEKPIVPSERVKMAEAKSFPGWEKVKNTYNSIRHEIDTVRRAGEALTDWSKIPRYISGQ